jgi:hypothetical protein
MSTYSPIPNFSATATITPPKLPGSEDDEGGKDVKFLVEIAFVFLEA